MADDVNYFYDGQVRRFLLQFARMFSHYQVTFGLDPTGNPVYKRVPIKYGNASKNASAILRNNSDNTVLSAPLMSFYIAGMEYDRQRVQEPYHVDKMNVRERTYDTGTDTFQEQQGNAFTIERLMPVPHRLKINLDIWTTSEEQKQELFEQLTWMFNPSFEIQSTDNYIDWTSLTVVERVGLNWSSKTVPVGTDEGIDIMTFNFEIPIWISAPAKVKKLGVITKILAGVYNDTGSFVNDIAGSDLLIGARQNITPTGYRLLLLNGQLQLVPQTDIIQNDNHSLEIPVLLNPNIDKWHPVVDMFGGLRDGISLMRLFNSDSNSEIEGTIAFNPTDDRYLTFIVDADTIPANTLPPITKVINPIRTGPGTKLQPSGNFPVASVGQRYLLLDDIGSSLDTELAKAWQGTDGSELIAITNDIIEYDGVKWIVAFDSRNTSSLEYMTNITTGLQYKWTGTEWIKSYEGIYEAGTWNIII